MATWIVGDVHGCFRTFQALLRQIRYDERSDRLRLVGDLINGGPASLEMLRWCAGRDGLESVLGNHDLYFLGRWSGACSRKHRDTLDSLLEAPDVDRLANWLRWRHLVITEPTFRIVHAGLLPEWSWMEVEGLAGKLEERLRGDQLGPFLTDYFRVRRDDPEQRVSEPGSLAGGLQILAMIRTCTPGGVVCRDFKGRPEDSPGGCRPWYEQSRNWAGTPLFFGHWAACGFRRLTHAVCLDSGCVWGKELTAWRTEDGQVVQQENLDGV